MYMNILWITNTIFPAPSRELGLAEPVTGGWMYGLASQMAASPGIFLSVATTYSGRELLVYDIEGIRYYLLPSKKRLSYDKTLESIWKEVCCDFKPDAVHIHGTEYPVGLACMRACSNLRYVVSIQGLVGIYSRYYYAGMSVKDILTNITLRDIIRGDTIWAGKKNFAKRGDFEKEYIHKTSHIIGRTSWDYAHTKSINSAVTYNFCNESLRSGFYTTPKWDINQKTNYTIFLSQAGYPIKGLHQVIKAAGLLKSDFPNISLRVAGGDITKYDTWKNKLKLSGYGKYIKGLISDLALQDNIEFLGSLNEERMIKEYLKANVFICPSSIENSPNSLGEAQLLGVPCIASYVGGVPDMVTEGVSGLMYRFEEVEMLAQNIRNIFIDNDLSKRLSLGGIEAASKRHCREINLGQTVRIYKSINSVI